MKKCDAGSGAIYGMGVVGALIYYITTSTSFLSGLAGIIKAIFWPAVVVFKVLEILGL